MPLLASTLKKLKKIKSEGIADEEGESEDKPGEPADKADSTKKES